MCTSTWLAPAKGAALRSTCVVAVYAAKGHEGHALDTKGVEVGLVVMMDDGERALAVLEGDAAHVRVDEGERALAVLEGDAASDRVRTGEALAVPVVECERLPEAEPVSISDTDAASVASVCVSAGEALAVPVVERERLPVSNEDTVSANAQG
jgi:hypothetical protein